MTIIKKPINQMSEASVLALYSLFENKGLSSLVEYIPGGSYDGIINFEKNYYFFHTQTTNLLFTAINTGKPFTMFQLTLNADTNYSIEFSPEFLIYRNDIEATNSVYHIWFCSLPGGNIGTSIVRVGTFVITPPVEVVPYSESLLVRYNSENVTVDEITNKVSVIINPIDTNLNLLSTTDSTRPSLDLVNKRLVFNSVAVTENKTATVFVNNTVWSVVFLAEFEANLNGSASITLLSNGTSKMFAPYTNTMTGYINNVLMSIVNSESLAKSVIGVHIYALIQTATALEYYVDGVLIKTQATSGNPLTLTNVMSVYNATKALPGKIKYVYDAMFYNIALDSAKLAEVDSFLNSKYPLRIPEGGPVIADFAFTNITQGQNLTLGDSVAFSYNITSGSAAEVYVYFLTAGVTYRVVVKGNTLNSVLIPSGLVVANNVYCKIVVTDTNGRSSNMIGTNAITFNRV